MAPFKIRSTEGISAIAPGIAAFLIFVTTTVTTPTDAFIGKPAAKFVLTGPGSLADFPSGNLASRWRITVEKEIVGPATVCFGARDGDDSDDENKDGVFLNEFDESSPGGGGGFNNLMKDTKDLMVGDWVVAKRDVPSLGIRAGAVYKLVSIFKKGGNPSNNEGLGVETLLLERYGDDNDNEYSGYQKYLKVYNPRDHGKTEGVVVTPEEIGLVSVKADWKEAALLAIPGFFWVFVATAFSNYYTDRYGGSFLDAFFRT